MSEKKISFKFTIYMTYTRDMLQLGSTFKWWPSMDGKFGYSKCRPNNSNEGVFIYKNSTGAHNDRTTKFCRPSTQKLLYNLKQSLLWSNLSMDKNYYISQNLLDSTFVEWSKRVWDNHCYSNCSARWFFTLNSTQKLESKESVVASSNESDASCKTESQANVTISGNETVQKSTKKLKDCTTMNVELKEYSANANQVIRHTKILILGAGLAGLGAAIKISNALNNASDKHTYLILEAQNKAGGRVKTEELLEYSKNKTETSVKHSDLNFVDAGAQWLHGRNNFLYTVSQNYRLLSSQQSEEGMGSFFHEYGNQIDPFFVKKVDFRIGELLSECEEFVRSKETVSCCPKSVGHFLREKFQKFVDCLENSRDRENAMDLFDWHVRFQIIDNSCLSLDQLSAKYWGRYSFNGEACQAHYNFKKCFGSVIDCLTAELNNKLIHYSKEVTEIRINNNDNNDRPSKRKVPNISVKCSDGSLYTADHVIVTFSLGVLKKVHKTLFHPNLPPSIQLAIESIGFETINKVFMEFDNPWWNDLAGIQFVFKHNKEKTQWTDYITGFDRLQPHSSNILLGWVGGIGAIQMEKLNDDQIIEDCVKLLVKFTNKTIPYPKRYYCTRWYSNRYVNGAYSYISTRCDKNETISHNVLGQSLSIGNFYQVNQPEVHEDGQKGETTASPVVLFAGEACHEKYFSTAHGAFLSGFEQAQRIVELYKQC
ncbi:peroxisomal N(1)-acetyl-spermine/spermidine oxidase-like isoform X2 [Sitodiplosis mosellana]|uniref:peroxisomal N(1)-acetyl-spermine/spermidine oxidase-like isoform X2 n=1 Tax=Sitodiplosis mosellana TaxID=263140 RepID=UPI0024450F72|nr:peroxisomal N(1)-acetyl-spermine/spermidine oxidase-like isoform X2 [Sitodiplosis mosellana]